MHKNNKDLKRLPYINADLYDAIRIYCIANRIEFKKFAEDALQEKLERSKVSNWKLESIEAPQCADDGLVRY